MRVTDLIIPLSKRHAKTSEKNLFACEFFSDLKCNFNRFMTKKWNVLYNQERLLQLPRFGKTTICIFIHANLADVLLIIIEFRKFALKKTPKQKIPDFQKKTF